MEKKVSLYLFIAFLFVSTNLFANDAKAGCKEEVLNARLKVISLPESIGLGHYFLLPNDNEMLCELTVWRKRLFRKTDRNKLTENYPQTSSGKEINSEEAEKIIDSWRQLENTEKGVEFEEKKWSYKKKDKGTLWTYHYKIKKTEFWIYNIKEVKWLKLNWTEGNKLLKKYLYLYAMKSKEKPGKNLPKQIVRYDNALWLKAENSDRLILQLTPHFKYSLIPATVSPDGSRIVYTARIREKLNYQNLITKLIKVGDLRYIHKTGVCCAGGEANKLFHLQRFSSFGGLESQGPFYWSSDGSFVVTFFEGKFRIIFFGKN